MLENLVACKTCKNPVAKKASVCPQCGRGRPGGGTTTGVFGVFVVVVLVIIVVVIWKAASLNAQIGAI